MIKITKVILSSQYIVGTVLAPVLFTMLMDGRKGRPYESVDSPYASRVFRHTI